MSMNQTNSSNNKQKPYPNTTIKKLQTLVTTISDWYKVIPDKLGIVSSPLTYHTRSGYRVVCRPKSPDINEVVIIFSDNEYPREKIAIQNDAVIFDLGGNIGLFSLYMDEANKGKAYKTFIFEPFSENVDLINQNLKINSITNCEVIESAVSDVDGFLYIDTTLPPDAISATKEEVGMKIPSTKLSTFAKSKSVSTIDLLKMDIEGGEYPLFKEDYAYIKSNVKAIIMEYHTISDTLNFETLNTLISKDFTIEHIYQMDHGGVFYAKNNKFIS
jgi:FkbM family methyltransferase